MEKPFCGRSTLSRLPVILLFLTPLHLSLQEAAAQQAPPSTPLDGSGDVPAPQAEPKSEQGNPPAPREPQDPSFEVTGAPGKGLTLEVGDTFSLNIKSRIQLRYQYHLPQSGQDPPPPDQL